MADGGEGQAGGQSRGQYGGHIPCYQRPGSRERRAARATGPRTRSLRARADRAEQGREGERARADALRDRIDATAAQLAAAEAEGAASDVEMANLTAQLRQARAEAQAA
jgi:hypothetical protein